MPQFREYNAPDTRLRPDNSGFSALETAGRRIGPAYNEAAQDVREGGKIQADLINLQKWPFDILALQQRDESGGGVRLGRGGSGGNLPSAGRIGAQGGAMRAHNQIASGMGALGNILGGNNDNTFGIGGADDQSANGTPNGYYPGSPLRAGESLAADGTILEAPSVGGGQTMARLNNGNIVDPMAAKPLDAAQMNTLNDKYAAQQPTNDLQRELVGSGDATITDLGIGGVTPNPPQQGFISGLISGLDNAVNGPAPDASTPGGGVPADISSDYGGIT